jgi:hypothetical protein
MDRVAGISTESVGTFHELGVRDAASQDRDGHPVFAVRRLSEDFVEVLFGDGIWVLSSPADITPGCGS